MAAQPTQDAIDTLCAISGMNAQEASMRLKNNNNDVNQALNEFYENPSSNQYVWDETDFSSERDGTATGSGISFQIQGADDHGSNSYPATRPPSRANNRSPLNDRVISLADEHAAADPRSRMSQDEMNDIDYQKALQQSAEEAGLDPQQYGVVNSGSKPHFGPANREEYKEGKWDLVQLPKQAGQEALSDPEPIDRRRDDGIPAFLRPSAAMHRLPSLLTIYHEIPLAREIFLDRQHLLSDYGYEKRWWEGVEILMSDSSPSVPFSDAATGETPPIRNRYTCEVQRLMAFLDQTDRSYGSSEALSNLPTMRAIKGMDMEPRFFDIWKRHHESDPLLASIFSKAIQPKASLSNDGAVGIQEAEEIDFAMLDLTVPEQIIPAGSCNLYDLADATLWATSGDTVEESAYIRHIADVVCFRLSGMTSQNSVSVPFEWFPDRYLESSRQAALEMRQRKAQVDRTLVDIFTTEERLTTFTSRSGQYIAVQDLFATSLIHDAKPEVDGLVFNETPEELNDMPNENSIIDRTDISVQLKSVLESIDRKLVSLDQEKERARGVLRELSTLYTNTAEDPTGPVLHRYTLRGVSVTKNITYLRRSAEPDLIDMEMDAEDSKTDKDQWWRIQFTATTSDRRPVNIQKVTREHVAAAIPRESLDPLLVYASDKAMGEPVLPLPDSLQAFVRADNLSFESEFLVEMENEDSPRSPGKRKHDGVSTELQESVKYRSEEPRWNGMEEDDKNNGVRVSHQEIMDDDDDTQVADASGAQSHTDDLDSASENDTIMITNSQPADLVDTSIQDDGNPLVKQGLSRSNWEEPVSDTTETPTIPRDSSKAGVSGAAAAAVKAWARTNGSS